MSLSPRLLLRLSAAPLPTCPSPHLVSSAPHRTHNGSTSSATTIPAFLFHLLTRSPTLPLLLHRHSSKRNPSGNSYFTSNRSSNSKSSKMGRKFFVGGNWKMNGTKASIDPIVEFLKAGPLDPNCGKKTKLSYTYHQNSSPFATTFKRCQIKILFPRVEFSPKILLSATINREEQYLCRIPPNFILTLKRSCKQLMPLLLKCFHP